MKIIFKLFCLSFLVPGFAFSTPKAKKTPRVKPSVILKPVADKIDRPTKILFDPTDDKHMLVLEQGGKVLLIQSGAPRKTLLDLSSETKGVGEKGLLGMAFHPKFPKVKTVYLDYTHEDKDSLTSRISSFQINPESLMIDKSSEKILLKVVQPYPNHNGGEIAFGPDGMLYISFGDGGAAGDPKNRAQDKTELLGKILRIDVDHGDPYSIPSDNPNLGPDAKKEIFAYGLRNTWRFSFDMKTGELWGGDVGQDAYEEVNIIKKGGNYGWRIMEGSHCFNPPQSCPEENLEKPILEYPRKDGISVTGGYVSYDKDLPELMGKYIFGDFGSGNIWSFDKINAHANKKLIFSSRNPVSSFGQDSKGGVYVATYSGEVFKLTKPNH